MPRSKNDQADSLVKLASLLTLLEEREIQIIIRERHLLALALDRFDETKEISAV